ncbi:MAG: glucose-6-phosphate dehydrogenase [Phycisphaerae bacterium]|nr:glucose-6-phosphate dehydrogenase [Phycisphaerae bacterium]
MIMTKDNFKDAHYAVANQCNIKPFFIVIFGATGDLTSRKLIPALFSLYQQKLLSPQCRIIAFARRPYGDESFRDYLFELMREYGIFNDENAQYWPDFAKIISYHQSSFDDPEGYKSLASKLHLSQQNQVCADVLYYLSTQPSQFGTIVENIKAAKLNHPICSAGWNRVIIEKPFGHDLETAKSLNAELTSVFDENQIYRIDHYLGKETVQNLLVLRFANAIFEPLWNNKYVDHIQIKVHESLGVGTRGALYDQQGALKDIVQNHIMHLLSLIAMEPPNSLEADAVRDAKVNLLKCIRKGDVGPDHLIAGQYSESEVNGQKIPAYRDENGVKADSATETYVALKLLIDNWRWEGVPFYIRTGKCMPARLTEVSVYFKSIPRVLYNKADQMANNCLTIQVQPDEGINLRFQVKTPGSPAKIVPADLNFNYSESFGGKSPDAYERLLLDAAAGDATLFTRSDEVLAAWRFIDPLVQGLKLLTAENIAKYPAGSWGPEPARDLIENDGRKWR